MINLEVIKYITDIMDRIFGLDKFIGLLTSEYFHIVATTAQQGCRNQGLRSIGSKDLGYPTDQPKQISGRLTESEEYTEWVVHEMDDEYQLWPQNKLVL